jgi:hypothetical protein
MGDDGDGDGDNGDRDVTGDGGDGGDGDREVISRRPRVRKPGLARRNASTGRATIEPSRSATATSSAMTS